MNELQRRVSIAIFWGEPSGLRPGCTTIALSLAHVAGLHFVRSAWLWCNQDGSSGAG